MTLTLKDTVIAGFFINQKHRGSMGYRSETNIKKSVFIQKTDFLST